MPDNIRCQFADPSDVQCCQTAKGGGRWCSWHINPRNRAAAAEYGAPLRPDAGTGGGKALPWEQDPLYEARNVARIAEEQWGKATPSRPWDTARAHAVRRAKSATGGVAVAAAAMSGMIGLSQMGHNAEHFTLERFNDGFAVPSLAAVAAVCLAAWAGMVVYAQATHCKEPRIRKDDEHGLVDGYGNTYVYERAWFYVPVVTYPAALGWHYRKEAGSVPTLDGGTAPTRWDAQWGSAADFRAADSALWPIGLAAANDSCRLSIK